MLLKHPGLVSADRDNIAKVTALCFFHSRRLSQICRVGKDITIRIVLALITPRLDYCNSVFADLPQSTLEPLQRVQNAAARLLFDLRHRDHVSCDHLMQLHWLPAWTLMHAIHNQRCPSYLSDTVQTVATATTSCELRSSATTDYVVPRTLPKFGERAFAYAGPGTSPGRTGNS